MPGVSCQQKFRRLRLGIEPEGFFTPGVQQQLNGFLEVAKALFLRLALAIRAGNFQTSCPKTAFVGFTLMNDGSEFLHTRKP